jgi:carbon-monoxide dehydrogenase large subunit
MAITASRGLRVKRIEDPRLLVGRGSFVDDLPIRGVGHVAILRSPHAHALIRKISAPRSVRLITAKDLGEPLWLPGDVEDGAAAHHPALAGDRVCYVGQPVAAVIADDAYRAADALEQVQVDYKPLPAVVDPDVARREDAPRLHPDLPSNVAYREGWRRGAPARGFGKAAVTITRRIHHQRLAAIPLEARAVAAVPPDRGQKTLTVWSSTQMPHGLRDELTSLLPLDGVDLRVIAPDVGGGFGAKGTTYPEEVLVPLLALRLHRPLKWIETRRENILTMCHGRAQFADVRMAASRDGRILAWEMRVVADLGAYLLSTTAEIPGLTLLMAQGPYDIRDVEVELVEVYTNKVPSGAYRGAGRPEATFYLERALDLVAAELQIDPAEVRRRNFIPKEAFPYRAVSGVTYDSGNYAAALDRAVEASGYAQWRHRQARERESGRLLGIGLSSYVETCTYGRDECKVELDARGKVTVYTGVSPHGQGGATGLAQIVADMLGVSVQAVSVVHGDTALIPKGDGTAGSRTLVVGGSAAFRGAEAVRQQVLERAAGRFEARVDDLVLSGGHVYVAGSPARRLTLGEIVAGDGKDRVLTGTGRYVVKGGTYPFGTHVVVVDVDPDTGEVRVLQHVAVDDCGVVINPLLVEGQIHGGVAQAVGQALYEEVIYDDSGQLLTGTLVDYAVPRAAAVPRVMTLRTETPSPRNPLGAKGVGEAGTIGATPAVVNAVIDALAPYRVRHLDMPLTPRKVWAAIHAHQKQ